MTPEATAAYEAFRGLLRATEPCVKDAPVDTWYSDDPRDVALAKSLCARCHIRAECAEYALEHERWGIWGGLTAAEREQLRKEGAA